MASSGFLMRKHSVASTANWSKLNDRKIFAIFGEFLLRMVRCWAISLVLLPLARFFQDSADNAFAGVMEW